jgi:excisionase family DNA binding protein
VVWGFPRTTPIFLLGVVETLSVSFILFMGYSGTEGGSMPEIFTIPAGSLGRHDVDSILEATGITDEAVENAAPGSVMVASSAGHRVTLPRLIYELVAASVNILATGKGIALVETDADFTTSQVADLLNVSRPHVVKLLEDGEIPFHMVGTHRRILVSDALSYRRHRDEVFHAAMAEMRRLGEDMNLSD